MAHLLSEHLLCGMAQWVLLLCFQVNIKLKIMVKIPTGKDPQQLAAAAAAWLHSDQIEQLLQQHGLHAGLGTPARLITVLPQKVTTVIPEVTGFGNGTGLPLGWRHESGAVSSSSSSGNGTLDMAVEIPTAAAAAAGDQKEVTETRPQIILIVVVTVLGSATLGAAAALGVVFQVRKRRRLAGTTSSSSSGEKGDGSNRSSTGARRRRVGAWRLE